MQFETSWEAKLEGRRRVALPFYWEQDHSYGRFYQENTKYISGN